MTDTKPHIYINKYTIVIEFDIDEQFAELLPRGFHYMSDENQNILGIYTDYVETQQESLINALFSLYQDIKERENKYDEAVAIADVFVDVVAEDDDDYDDTGYDS